MPGIDFQRLRAEITMRQVLELIGFKPHRCRGDQWYGPCPLHPPNDGQRATSFSVNVATQRYTCHRCGSHGNPLELWADFCKRPLYPATLELCRQLRRPIPWL